MMKDAADVLAAEDRFLDALVRSDTTYLKKVTSEDFVLIDPLSGRELPRTDLLCALDARSLQFPVLKRDNPSVRFYDTTALVTGSILMSIDTGGASITISSRYTHVYTELEGRWLVVSAQSTPVSSAPAVS